MTPDDAFRRELRIGNGGVQSEGSSSTPLLKIFPDGEDMGDMTDPPEELEMRLALEKMELGGALKDVSPDDWL